MSLINAENLAAAHADGLNGVPGSHGRSEWENENSKMISTPVSEAIYNQLPHLISILRPKKQ